MASTPRDCFNVDLRGLKATLLAHARARRTTPAEILRQALIKALEEQGGAGDAGAAVTSARACAIGLDGPPARRVVGGRVRVHLRLQEQAARSLIDGAARAGLSPGEFVAGLVEGVPVIANGGSRGDLIRALRQSSETLATMSRDLALLTNLLSRGSIQAAREYRDRLDQVGGDVREHLKLLSAALAELRPARGRAPGATRAVKTVVKTTDRRAQHGQPELD